MAETFAQEDAIDRAEQLLDLRLKDQDAFGAKTRVTRKIEKIRDVVRKLYIHS